jgi:hypothetical protein
MHGATVKIYSIATVAAINPTLTGLRWNPGFQAKWPVISEQDNNTDLFTTATGNVQSCAT